MLQLVSVSRPDSGPPRRRLGGGAAGPVQPSFFLEGRGRLRFAGLLDAAGFTAPEPSPPVGRLGRAGLEAGALAGRVPVALAARAAGLGTDGPVAAVGSEALAVRVALVVAAAAAAPVVLFARSDGAASAKRSSMRRSRSARSSLVTNPRTPSCRATSLRMTSIRRSVPRLPPWARSSRTSWALSPERDSSRRNSSALERASSSRSKPASRAFFTFSSRGIPHRTAKTAFVLALVSTVAVAVLLSCACSGVPSSKNRVHGSSRVVADDRRRGRDRQVLALGDAAEHEGEG